MNFHSSHRLSLTLAAALLALCATLTCPGQESPEAVLGRLNQALSEVSQTISLGYPTNSAVALELGKSDARRDLSNGVYVMKTFGLPSSSRGDYERLLKERCNATLQPIAGCVVSEGLMSYARGYNEISSAAIRGKFGTNIFEVINQEAKVAWQKKQAPVNSSKGTYLIKSGDTLLKIARDHKVTFKDLMAANPGVNPTALQVGKSLVIPQK